MPQQKLECNDIRMITSLAERNLGIGVLSYIDALPYLERDELVFKPIIEKGMHPLTLALCVHRNGKFPYLTNHDEPSDRPDGRFENQITTAQCLMCCLIHVQHK